MLLSAMSYVNVAMQAIVDSVPLLLVRSRAGKLLLSLLYNLVHFYIYVNNSMQCVSCSTISGVLVEFIFIVYIIILISIGCLNFTKRYNRSKLFLHLHPVRHAKNAKRDSFPVYSNTVEFVESPPVKGMFGNKGVLSSGNHSPDPAIQPLPYLANIRTSNQKKPLGATRAHSTAFVDFQFLQKDFVQNIKLAAIIQFK